MNAIQANARLDQLRDWISTLDVVIGNLGSNKDFLPQTFSLQQIRAEISNERNELQNKLQELEVK